jgi:hypothetical protein
LDIEYPGFVSGGNDILSLQNIKTAKQSRYVVEKKYSYKKWKGKIVHFEGPLLSGIEDWHALRTQPVRQPTAPWHKPLSKSSL